MLLAGYTIVPLPTPVSIATAQRACTVAAAAHCTLVVQSNFGCATYIHDTFVDLAVQENAGGSEDAASAVLLELADFGAPTATVDVEQHAGAHVQGCRGHISHIFFTSGTTSNTPKGCVGASGHSSMPNTPLCRHLSPACACRAKVKCIYHTCQSTVFCFEWHLHKQCTHR